MNSIIQHYAVDVEYSSMFVAKLTGESLEKLTGRENLREYLSKGLQAYPNLHFVLENLFSGVDSIVLQYQSVNNLMAAEMFELNDLGEATQVKCHYYQR